MDKSSDHQSLINKSWVVFEKRAKHNTVINKIRRFARSQSQIRNISSKNNESQTLSDNFVTRTKDFYKDVKKKFAAFNSSLDVNLSPFEASKFKSNIISTKLIANMSSSNVSKLKKYASDESLSTSESGCGSSVKTSSLSTDSNRSSICTVDDFTNTGLLVKNPFIGHGVALVDCSPCPYDKDALPFKKGDIINIIAKNDSGTWIGMNNGKIGHFKFINIEEINHVNQSMVESNQESLLITYYENIINNLLSNSDVYLENSLKILLKMIGLDKHDYFNLLQEKGFQSLSSLVNITNQSVLEMIGITDRDHQNLIMILASIVRQFQSKLSKSADINDLENNISNITLNSNQCASRLTSGSKLRCPNSKSNLTLSNIYNYDNIFESQKTYKIRKRISSQNENLCTHQFNKSEKEKKTNKLIITTFSNNSILVDDNENNDYDCDDDDDGDDNDDDDDCDEMHNQEKKIAEKKIVEKKYRGSLDTNILVKKLEHGYKFHSSNYGDINSIMTPINSSRSVFNLRQIENYPNNESSLSYHPPYHLQSAKRRFKKFLNSNEKKSFNSNKINDRKYTSVNALHLTSKPISPHLLDIILKLLHKENIDLALEPYSDNSGFCGIPPALVQRYAEELELDIYDIADTLDYIRLNCLLKKFGKQGIPNDFLADSCTGSSIDFANYENLHNWLVSLGLPMYEEKLILKGYNHLWHIKDMREDDLINCGINNKRHLRALSIAIGVLSVNQHKIGKV